MKRRLIAGISCAAMIITSIGALCPENVMAEENTIHIASVEDLKEFSNNCRLDSYSEDLTVELDCDLDLENDPFTPIPTFMGTFHGNGHTISGFVCANDGSNQGFFRYLEEEGTITKLNVCGEVSPENGQENIGGLVGTNYGTIKYCTFDGDVSGLKYTGGLVGYNEGTILVCGVKGDVEGKNYTGGICGYNEGNVIGCSNASTVNIEVRDSEVDVDDLASVDVTDLETLASSDNDGVKDTGGIVGGSEGIIQNCTNKGTVGYQHYGYNVGGIAGRQSGFITGCNNYGEVYGKKDVAGICGQMEPHLYILDSASLSEELQALNDSISVAMSDLSGDAASMSGELNALKGTASSATIDAEEYESLVEDLYNDATTDDEEAEKEEKKETAKQTASDISSTIEGVDDQTKSDIASGNVDESTADKVIDSAKENGGSTGQSASDAADKVKEDAGSINDSTVEDIKNGNVTADDISNITDTAKNSAAAEAISSGASSIAAKKNAEQAEEDAKQAEIDQMLADAQNALSEKVATIGNALADMNDRLADMTGDFADNMQDVNDQFSRVNQLLTCILTGDMTYYEDISALDTEEDVDGKISYCTNYGSIEGDEDVGGIGGEIALEKEIDEDEDLITNGLAVSGVDSQMYETRAVIRSCSNEASIYSRKCYAGGIAGKGDTGMIIYSENYGDVSSDSEYVGGIIGTSETLVVGSYAMCDLSGEGYIGGIAGNANQITDCLTIVNIEDEHACCTGAIAGYIDITKRNAAVNNYFISDTLGAIDGISYQGKAEPTTAEDLYSNENVPDDFRNMVVTFEADDVTIYVAKVPYGTALDETTVPDVPEKEGYTGVWEDIDLTNVTESMTVEAVYYQKQDSLESELVRDEDGLPVLIVEGEFEGTASVTATQIDTSTVTVDKGNVMEALDIVVDNSGEEVSADGYQVRYLAPDKKTDVKLYLQNEDGSLSEVSYNVEGSYLSFAIPSAEATLVCAEGGVNILTFVIAGAAAAIVILVAVLFIALKKNRKKANDADEDADDDDKDASPKEESEQEESDSEENESDDDESGEDESEEDESDSDDEDFDDEESDDEDSDEEDSEAEENSEDVSDTTVSDSSEADNKEE